MIGTLGATAVSITLDTYSHAIPAMQEKAATAKPAAETVRRLRMDESKTIAEVKKAADSLLAAFGEHRTDDYFQAFDPEATFVFWSSPEMLDSRAAFRERWERLMREEGFRVLECVSSNQRVLPFGDVAVFTHSVKTRQRTNAGEETLLERETIVFSRQADGSWLAVHEHLSPDPNGEE